MAGVKEIPQNAKWSGKDPVPAIGDKVNVRMNGIGPGTVTSYSAATGEGITWLAVWVQVENPPDWFRRQNPDWAGKSFMFFGIEIEAVK